MIDSKKKLVKVNYSFVQKVQIFFIEALAKVQWNQTKHLSEQDDAELKSRLAKDYYIIGTRRGNFLTTYLIGFGHWLLTGRFGRFSHVLMNLENEVEKTSDFRFIEATGHGTGFNTFEGVFGTVDRVCLIVPKKMSKEQWTIALDAAKEQLGAPYDNLFDLKNDLEVNCVELIRIALQRTEGYAENFAEFERMLKAKKKITPDMFAQCSDFEVVFEIKK